MAGSEPIYQTRDGDSRYSDAEQRPFYNLNGILQPVDENNIEGPILGVDEPPTDGRFASLNRAVDFEGDKYWWHNNYVRVNIPGSGWTVGDPGTGGQAKTVGVNIPALGIDYQNIILGLFPMISKSDGQQRLVALYIDDDFTRRLGARIKESKFTSTGGWSAEITMQLSTSALNGSTANVGGWGYYGRIGNKVYLQFRANEKLENNYVEVDLDTITAIEYVAATTPSNTVSSSGSVTQRMAPDVFCPYSGFIWRMCKEGGHGVELGSSHPSNSRTSWYLERPSITPVVDLILVSGLSPDGGLGVANDSWEGRTELFVDPDVGKMYGMTFIRGSGNRSGFACWQMRYDSITDALINEGNVGETVLPPPFRLKTGTDFLMTSRWKAYNLVNASGESTVILEVMRDGQNGTLVNTYGWNGPNTQMTFLGQGGNAKLSRPNIKIGGGEYVSSPRQPYDLTFRVDAVGAPAGTVNLRTRILGSGQAVKLRWLFTDKSVSMTREALVQNASSGTLIGNQLSGIIASSGIEYVVQWRLQDQNVQLTNTFDIHPVAENA